MSSFCLPEIQLEILITESFTKHCCINLSLIGDFSGSLGDIEDYIAGVDCLPNRDVVDYKVSKEGEWLFLVDSNCCVMNGRNCLQSKFTFIGPQGASAVD